MSKPVLTALIIGAGFAGVCSAIKLRAAGVDDFIIVEKTGGISGTWFDNAYPGAACDVPSHLYSFSFALNPNWSRKYSPAPEIRAYVEKTVEDFDIQKHIHQNTEITSAHFDEKQGHWVIESKGGDVFNARFLITSVAILGTPQIPDIQGVDTFTGKGFHTARWPKNLDISGKSIAVIGSAASALQIIPEIVKTAAKVSVFQRTANFVLPREDRAYSKIEKFLWRTFPWILNIPRFAIFARADFLVFHNFKSGSFINRHMTKVAHAYRKKKVRDPVLRETLTPNYTMGCKRILLSDNYFQALQQDNVDVITTPIKEITPRGIATKNQEIDADIIVYATGFKTTTFMPNLEMTGNSGTTLSAWRERPQALRGLVIENMPNAFFLLGPNTNLGHSSMILMIEAQVEYMVQCMQAVPANTYISVKPSAMQTYNEDIQKHLKHSVWSTGCASWYKSTDGSNPTMWPHQTSVFRKMMRKFDKSEYDFIKFNVPN